MRNRKELVKYLLGSAFCFITTASVAQILVPQQSPGKFLTTAREQFEQQHYAAAISATRHFLSSHPAQDDESEQAGYILLSARLKLAEQGADDDAVSFLKQTSNSAYKQRISYLLAQYYFKLNSFSNAISYYEAAENANLSNEEIIDEKFELAYCYFNTKQFDKAEPLLASIKELQGKYYKAGNYYYGLLAYNRNNYDEALTSFQRIENEKEYADIVPYYITELHYFLGNKDKAYQYAVKLIERSQKNYYDNELHLIAAQILFEQSRFNEAVPYFEYFYSRTDKIRKEDLYEMGYCYYRTDRFNDAIDKFKPLSNAQDSLGQTAMYLLGDCYLKTGDKKGARNAFSICSDMSFNARQQETSLLLTTKLSYEMGYNDEALARIKTLLALYPESSYKNEAKTLLSELLVKTNNYEEAFNALQDVTDRNEEFRRIYQVATYGYAIRQMQHDNFVYADSLLALSLQYPVDAAYTNASHFWKAEAGYKLQHYADALEHGKIFTDTYSNKVTQLSPAATMQNAYLNMGYAAFELKDYTKAQQYFNQARQGQPSVAGNAILREADAAFMQKNYAQAISLYIEVINTGNADADYARFQKALISGLTGKNNEKISMLQELVSHSSAYSDDARYELALTYIQEDKYQSAINILQPAIAANSSRIIIKALMKTGFAYQQLNKDEEAIKAYRRVVTDFPAAEERPAALDALKGIYLENNQPGAYAALLKEVNITPSSNSSLDSAYYSAAEAQFSAGRWDKTKLAMQEYLAQYPSGLFTVKAHYYKAESHYQLKEYADALKEYDAVLSGAWSDFTENSARRAAGISMQNKDDANVVKYYSILRNTALGADNLKLAYNGLMQGNYALNNFDAATAYADTLSGMPGIDEATKNDILLLKARSLQRNNRSADAQAVYTQLQSASNNAIAAESRYHIAEIYLQQNKMKEAEEAANNAIQKSAGNDYWVVKAYLLIADILTRQKDYFNAKATLQSVIKNTKVQELKQDASIKLEEVKALEKKQSKLSEE